MLLSFVHASKPFKVRHSRHAAAPHPRHFLTEGLGMQCYEIGTASWYGITSQGKPTASGELYDSRSLTAASREIPLGTELNVVNLDNQRHVTVVVNDRGPYVRGRILDLSIEAARQLRMKKEGLAPVCIQVVNQTGTSGDSQH